MRNFKDLEVWSEAHKIALDVYKVTTSFPKEEINERLIILKKRLNAFIQKLKSK